MNRTGEPSVEALLARIAALQVENRQLTERVVRLEEELALARLHRFAPRSEKHVDRLFNEAEQAADEDDAGSEMDNIASTGHGLATRRSNGKEARPWSTAGEPAA